MFPRTPIRLKPGICPHKFECRTETVKRPQNLLSKRKAENDRREMVENMLVSESEDEEMVDDPNPPVEEVAELESLSPQNLNFDPNLPSTSHAFPFPHSYAVECIDKGVQVKMKPYHYRSVKVQCVIAESVDSSVQAVPDLVDVGTSTVDKLNVAEIFTSSDDDIESLPTDSVLSEFNPSQSSDTSSAKPSTKQFEDLKKRVGTNTMLYLGLPTNASFVIGLLAKYCKSTERDIYLCLKKIRLNEPYSILSYEFDLSPSYLGTIFRNVLPKVAECLNQFVFWPSKNQVFSNLPITFRARFSKVVAIIDCFELEIQKPSNSLHQSMTWSAYKKCNTLKYLIACTPDGTCCFISEGWGGRTSDSVILKKSGFLDLIEPGVQIMADRGFKHVEKDISEKGGMLVRPPSVVGTETFSKADAHLTKQIAALRIHVERVIGRLRNFNILAPHVCLDNKLVPLVNDITKVVCALTNLQSPLIK